MMRYPPSTQPIILSRRTEVSQPDTAHEVLPVDMNWRHGTDFSPRILPADSEVDLISGLPVEDVPDPIGEAALIHEREEESDSDEEMDPKDLPVSEPVIVPTSPTQTIKDAF
jgi:hypothetical protein